MNLVTDRQREWIEESQGLVRSLAVGVHRRIGGRVELDDLIAYGQVGLMQAAKSFDASNGASFQTFAYYRVRGAIYDGMNRMRWVPRGMAKRLQAESLAGDVLEQVGGEASIEEPVAPQQRAGWLVRTSRQLALVHLLSTDPQTGKDAAAQLPDRAPDPSEQAAQADLIQRLRELIAGLDVDERRLVELTYYEGASLAEAGRRLGRSKSWASRLHSQLIGKLARLMSRPGVGDFVE
jgi:RNA polymerase sigma factor for flagellar operon FliA